MQPTSLDELERWCVLIERALADDGIELALDAIKAFPGPIDVERPSDDLEASRVSRLAERVSHLDSPCAPPAADDRGVNEWRTSR
jgi:hypothetical protein